MLVRGGKSLTTAPGSPCLMRSMRTSTHFGCLHTLVGDARRTRTLCVRIYRMEITLFCYKSEFVSRAPPPTTTTTWCAFINLILPVETIKSQLIDDGTGSDRT